jgi:hypothetical protein
MAPKAPKPTKAKPTKRTPAARKADDRRRSPRSGQRRPAEAAARRAPTRDQRSAPQTNPIPRPVDNPGRPKNASQAKARAKARKAKAPKVVRPPLRERIVVKLASVELNPRALVARVPFVVLVIGSLGVGLGTTLWLSTDAAERSYQLSSARQTNEALLQQKEALERDVQKAQAAPALAEAARNLGMIPSRDTAHLVQDPAGNWIVVGTPKPAAGVPPAPLNTPLPDEAPPGPPPPPAPRVVDPRELSVRLPGRQQPAPVPGAIPGAPLAPAAPLAIAPGTEVPQAVSPPAAPLAGAVPAAPLAPPAAPVAPPPAAPADAAAPLSAETPHLPSPAALPGPAPAQQQPPAIPGAPA